jgi:hypothetical protein
MLFPLAACFARRDDSAKELGGEQTWEQPPCRLWAWPCQTGPSLHDHSAGVLGLPWLTCFSSAGFRRPRLCGPRQASKRARFQTQCTQSHRSPTALPSHPTEHDAQIVCGHFNDVRNRESNRLGYRSNRLEVSQTPGRVAIPKVPVERLMLGAVANPSRLYGP